MGRAKVEVRRSARLPRGPVPVPEDQRQPAGRGVLAHAVTAPLPLAVAPRVAVLLGCGAHGHRISFHIGAGLIPHGPPGCGGGSGDRLPSQPSLLGLDVVDSRPPHRPSSPPAQTRRTLPPVRALSSSGGGESNDSLGGTRVAATRPRVMGKRWLWRAGAPLVGIWLALLVALVATAGGAEAAATTRSAPFTVDTNLTLASGFNADELNTFVKKYEASSPLAKYGTYFVQAEQKSGVNAQGLLAIAINPTVWGTARAEKDNTLF